MIVLKMLSFSEMNRYRLESQETRSTYFISCLHIQRNKIPNIPKPFQLIN